MELLKVQYSNGRIQIPTVVSSQPSKLDPSQFLTRHVALDAAAEVQSIELQLQLGRSRICDCF